jgi:hypothetical protein
LSVNPAIDPVTDLTYAAHARRRRVRNGRSTRRRWCKR